MRMTFVLGIILACHALMFCSDNQGKTIVSGTVSIMLDMPERVNGAKVIFRDADGRIVQAIANKIGEYEASLTPERDYTITVEGMSVCAMHRPAFRAKAGVSLRFDFVTTICGIIDHIRIGPPISESDDFRHYYDTPTPYWFFEERVPIGEDHRNLIIAFGAQKQDTSVTYGPFHVPKYQGVLPVTVSFGTYTVRADKAVLDRRALTLLIEGNVSVADGGTAPPRTERCVMLHLDAEPQVQSCEAAASFGPLDADIVVLKNGNLRVQVPVIAAAKPKP
jgi:hypothetical protein